MTTKIFYQEDLLERFIPITKQIIIEDLIANTHWNAANRQHFERFCALLLAHYHRKYHDRLERLKRTYLPFSPDRDTLVVREYSQKQRKVLQQHLLTDLCDLVEGANYKRLSATELNEIFSRISPYGLQLYVDLDDFDEALLYYRGLAVKRDLLRDWTTFFFRKKPVEVEIYRRLFLMIKLKEREQRIQEKVAEGFSEKRARRKVDWDRRIFAEGMNESHIHLKMFKDIPCVDLEMLFPNTRVRMKLFDKIKLSVTCGGGTVGGLVTTITKLAVAINPLGMAVAFVGLVGVIVRQVVKIISQRTHYMMLLAQKLYFHNLSNNRGVLSLMHDRAEEEDTKEAILAYAFLCLYGDRVKDQTQLKKQIDQYIQERYGIAVDFDSKDALTKLSQDGLVDLTKGLSWKNLEESCTLLEAHLSETQGVDWTLGQSKESALS